MEEYKISEGNILIAEFFDGEKCKHPNNLMFPNTEMYKFPIDINGSHTWNIAALKFHSSWDWLMPVIEKIGIMRDIQVKLPFGYMIIDDYKRDKTFYHLTHEKRWIMCCWVAIVEFINDHNERKQ